MMMKVTIKQILIQGIKAHRKGKVKEAESLYKTVLQKQPTQPDANHNLGLLAVSENRCKDALPLFKTALETNPKIKQFWLSYISLLIREKQFDNAKKVVHNAGKHFDGEDLIAIKALLVNIQSEKINIQNPSKKQLSSLLELYNNGNFGDAEKIAKSITINFPKHPFSWKVLGAIFKETGRNLEALNINKNVVALSPQDPEAHYNLGVIFKELGKLEEAEDSYMHAISLKNNFAEAHNNLGNTLKEQGRLDKAEASYRKAVGLKTDFAEAYNNLGITLQELGVLNEAELNYRKAIALKTDYAEAYNNLGATLLELGKIEKAEERFKKAIKYNHNYTEAHRNLSIVKSYNFQDKQYLKMQELYFDKNISEEQRCHINFGLAKACEDLEDFEQAFKHYSEGNKIRKKLLGYNISQDIKIFKQLKRSYYKIRQNSNKLDIFEEKPVPIFIVGMNRSGTTLVEQIISSHSQVMGSGELPFVAQFGGSLARGHADINRLSLINFRRKYRKKLQNIFNGKKYLTDKCPQNFYYIGLLNATFPEAKILHVKRNPASVCWANYTKYFISRNLGYCYDLDDIIKYHSLYQNLIAFWKKNLPNRIYDVDYELLTFKQEEETRKLINFIGLKWEDKCMSPQDNARSVATASNIQVRKKVYQGSSQEWKKYQPFLNGALDVFPLPENF